MKHKLIKHSVYAYAIHGILYIVYCILYILYSYFALREVIRSRRFCCETSQQSQSGTSKFERMKRMSVLTMSDEQCSVVSVQHDLQIALKHAEIAVEDEHMLVKLHGKICEMHI